MSVPFELVLVGLPIPSAILLAEYISQVVEVACVANTNVSFKTSLGSLGEVELKNTIYLRPSVSEIAPVVSMQEANDRSKVNLQIAQYFDAFWRASPSVTLEQSLVSDSVILNFLTSRLRMELRADNRNRLKFPPVPM